MVSELTIVKGAFSVTLYSTIIAENYTNKIFLITPAQSSVNQASGAVDTKVVDLLRVTHQLVIKCFLTGTETKTAKQVKDDLISIFNGGGVAGGTTTLTYDSDEINGYIEKVNIVEKSSDDQSTAIRDEAKYEVSLTFVGGVTV